jgi:hypothetical protein
MSDFYFADWRREIEQAISRAEQVPIRVLLDQCERAFERIEAEAQEMQAIWDNADPGDTADAADATGEAS